MTPNIKNIQEVSQDAQVARNLMAHDAMTILRGYNFLGGRTIALDELDSPALQGSLQGVNLARFILKWAETLVWPDAEHVWGDDLTGQMIMRWGVSWFELYVNFLICTGQYCPVRVSGSIDKAQYVDYSSDLARVLPSDRRSAMTQCTTFQAAFRCTESILKKKLIPDDIQKGGKAIHRFGFTGQIASLAICPKMLRQPETINAVYEYIKLAPTKNKLRQSVDKVKTCCDITLDPVPEPSPEQRFKSYKMIYKRRCQG